MSHRTELSARLGYASNGLDRAANHRDDGERMAQWRADPLARTVLLQGDIPLTRRIDNALSPWFAFAEAAEHGAATEEAFLGLDEGRPRFAMQLAHPAVDSDQGQGDLVALDLRSLAVQGLLGPADLGALAQAKSLIGWHLRHRFCANCGAPTSSAAGGWRRECEACKAQHFPRTDPVVIMLAIRGDRCLLARQPRFPPGTYSCLAGFVEPGETFEDAVRREIFEEAGVRVGRVRYLASQPWPFPSSLMIGCLCEALDEDLTIDRQELEDARWFRRDEVAQILAGTHDGGVRSPPPIAIAHWLERAFVEGESF
jgi:NAD+ diphosphatase